MHAYISELFYSCQGEGVHVGCPSIFLRLFGCNLNCKGFGQKCPTNPASYEIEKVDGTNYKSIKDVVVPRYGCDTPYARDKSFLHLCEKLSVKETASKIINLIATSVHNTDCRFTSENGTNIHLVITGGEPMLQQPFISQLIEELEIVDLKDITIETNGTVKLEECLIKACIDKNLFMSVSPKLFNCSGIKTETAIKLDVLEEYAYFVPHGQLKFVVGTELTVWNELADIYNSLNPQRRYPIVIMPVGSTLEQLQENSPIIAEMCLERGYRFSPRLHVNLWGNKSGT